MDPKNSTIIINANILTMDGHLNAYPNGYVKIIDGLIEAVGEDFQGSPESTAPFGRAAGVANGGAPQKLLAKTKSSTIMLG